VIKLLKVSPVLLELLQTLKEEQVWIELDSRMYRGDLVDVRTEGESFFLTMKDVIHGDVKLSCSKIRQVWHRGKIVWHYVTERPMEKRTFYPLKSSPSKISG